MRIRGARALFAIVCLAGLALAWCGGSTRADDAGIVDISVDGYGRSYGLERVGAGEPRGRLPVIVFLHGSGTDIRQPIPPRFDVPFDRLPGMEPALVVRPQGFDGRWSAVGTFELPRRLWRWVTGRATERPDETAFLDAVVARVIAEAQGDPARVYVVGVSSGGSMALRLACAPNQPFAAYAAVLATAAAEAMPACVRQRPVSLLLLASTTDPTVPYRGGAGDAPGEQLSAPETALAFAERDRCGTRTETPLPHADAASPSTVALIRYADCAEGSAVLFYRVDGSGHSVPSRRPPEPGNWRENGARNTDLETSQAVWDFFRSRSRAEAPAPKS
jgi:polyhydroxybutyrate depolymerase